MNKLIEYLKLRDPIWQAFGVIIGVVAAVISTLVAYDIYSRSTRSSELSIVEGFSFNPISFGDLLEGRVSLSIDGVSAESSLVYYYTISNSGQNPIKPEDYAKPIQVSLDEPWELITVVADDTWPSDFEVTWTKVSTNTFEMEPILLNPRDSMSILLFTNSPDEGDEEPNLQWTARISNLSELNVLSSEEREQQIQSRLFGVSIYHREWSILWLTVVAILLCALAIRVGIRSNRITILRFPQVILLLLIMTLSFSSAEIIVDVVVNRREQWWGVGILILLHIIVFLYLALPLITKRFGINRLRPGNVSDAEV